jgi:hypothetical protein
MRATRAAARWIRRADPDLILAVAACLALAAFAVMVGLGLWGASS